MFDLYVLSQLVFISTFKGLRSVYEGEKGSGES
jgi:hypothetical protein